VSRNLRRLNRFNFIPTLQTKTPRLRKEPRRNNYFFALQVGQCAQSVLPSAQQAIPQSDFMDSSAQQLEAVRQPVSSIDAAQRTRAATWRNFIDFNFWRQLGCQPLARRIAAGFDLSNPRVQRYG
jgi:hypothetical protein